MYLLNTKSKSKPKTAHIVLDGEVICWRQNAEEWHGFKLSETLPEGYRICYRCRGVECRNIKLAKRLAVGPIHPTRREKWLQKLARWNRIETKENEK